MTIAGTIAALLSVVFAINVAQCWEEPNRRPFLPHYTNNHVPWMAGSMDMTLVTSMIDIGRGQWNSSFARPYSEYLSNLRNVMNLKVNVVAFVDAKAATAVRRMRERKYCKCSVISGRSVYVGSGTYKGFTNVSNCPNVITEINFQDLLDLIHNRSKDLNRQLFHTPIDIATLQMLDDEMNDRKKSTRTRNHNLSLTRETLIDGASAALVEKPYINTHCYLSCKAGTRLPEVLHHHRTLIVRTSLQDLPHYQLRDQIRDIMESEEYRRDNLLSQMGHPEAVCPEYDILMLSKPYLLHLVASRLDPFNTSYFLWLDGGYGHGQPGVFPSNGDWQPRDLTEHGDKITVIERGPLLRSLSKHRHLLHKVRIAPLVGGFFAGGKKALRRLHTLTQEVVADWLKAVVIDDDQSCMAEVYYREPSLFRTKRGGWFDAFRLFHKEK